MPTYLVRLAQAHESFRKVELQALADLAGVDLDFVKYEEDVCRFYNHVIFYPQKKKFCITSLSDTIFALPFSLHCLVLTLTVAILSVEPDLRLGSESYSHT